MRLALGAALASSALLAASARPWGAAWLAWVALVPAFLAMTVGAGRRPLVAGLVGFVAAAGFMAVAYEAAIGLSVTAYLLVVPAAALPFAAATAAGAWVVGRLGRASALIAYPALWCAAEVAVRQEWLLGRLTLPFSAIGYTQSDTVAVHLARFGSVTAISLALLLANGLLAAGVLSTWAGRRLPLIGLGVVALTVWSAWRTAPAEFRVAAHAETDLTRIGLLQPATPTSVRATAQLNPAVANELMGGLLRLRSHPGETHALEVWPEAAWPGWLSRGGVAEPSLDVALAGLPPTLLGAATRDPAGAVGNAVFVSSGSGLTHVFDKRHPVPVAEAAIVASTGPAIVSIGGTKVAPLICYDIAFPATVRSAARNGAELIAVLTDDTFAAGSDVPLQHLRVARLRAVESGLWLAFASNGGPSALIDPAGRLTALTRQGDSTVLSAAARLGTGSTPYLRYGDWVGVLAGLLSGSLACRAGIRGGA